MSSLEFEEFPIELHHHIITYCHVDQLQTLLECSHSLFHTLILSSKYVLNNIVHYVRFTRIALEELDLSSNAISILWQMLAFGNKHYQKVHELQKRNGNEENNKQYTSLNCKFSCDVLQILLELLEENMTEPLWIPFAKHCVRGIENASAMDSFTDVKYGMLNKMLSFFNYGLCKPLMIADRYILNVVLREILQLDIQSINDTKCKTENPRFSSILHFDKVDNASNNSSYFVYHRIQVLIKLLKDIKLDVNESIFLFKTFITGNENECQISHVFELFACVNFFEMDSIPILFQEHILPRFQMEFSYKLRSNEWICFQNFMCITNKRWILPTFYSLLNGMKELWIIIFTADDAYFNNALRLYFSFMKKMKLRTTDDIRNAIEIRSKCLYKCITELRKANESVFEMPQKKQFINVYRVLRMIRYLLSNTRLSSRIDIEHPLHIQLQNSVPFEIQINDQIHIDMENNVQRLMVRETMTLYDIQKIFASECPSKIPPECIDFGYDFIKDSLRTIGEMGLTSDPLQNHYSRVGIHNHPKEFDLLTDEKNNHGAEYGMVGECVKILTDIFLKNTPKKSNGVWRMEDFRRYIFLCGAGNASASNFRIARIFFKHCTDNEMTLGSFLRWNNQACIDREYSVWCDLYVHGYRYDFRRDAEVVEFEKPIFKRENSLFYQMIDNEEYWNAIQQCFRLPFSEDRKLDVIYGNIKDVAYDILLHLPTNVDILQKMKIGIKTVSIVDELFVNNNLKNSDFVDFYWLAYRLILCEWLGTNDKKWGKLFMKKNGVQFMNDLIFDLRSRAIPNIVQNAEESGEETKENEQLPSRKINTEIIEKCISSISRIQSYIEAKEKESSANKCAVL